MAELKVGVVFTSGVGRRENLERSLEWLLQMSQLPSDVVIVLDGHEEIPQPPPTVVPVGIARIPKHEPGMEQPRNVGVRLLRERDPEVTHAWFLDSDILVSHVAFTAYLQEAQRNPDAVLIGPYEWMAEGMREPRPDLHNDPRWEMFNERSHRPHVAELGVALGCFGGNLVWPVEEFIRVGGFHPQLHHGRCEDGELGLRAASHQIPMVLVPEARGYHMAHPVNLELALERNRRDVPLLNAWHPWVEQQGLVVTDQDGARFDFVCECGAQVNTLEMYAHMAMHVLQARHQELPLILPEGL